VVTLLYERGTGTFAWGRLTTAGLIKSVATLPGQSGYDDVYLIVKRGNDYYLELLDEREQIFLDGNKIWNGNAEGYGPVTALDETGAERVIKPVVYDETENIVYDTNQPPIAGHAMWIGYPYTSAVRSMPVIANDRMKQNIIKKLYIRFHDSFMPRVKSLPGNVENTIPQAEPFTGVALADFPGTWERDVFFELIHAAPTRCRILSVNAEAN
jgi:hypothetical protein